MPDMKNACFRWNSFPHRGRMSPEESSSLLKKHPLQSLAHSGVALNAGKRETGEFPATGSLCTGIERNPARVLQIAISL